MFKKLSESLKAKFGRKDYLSRQLEIVKIFDIYQVETGIRPTSLKNKILVIPTRSSVEANELRMREHEVVEKINQELGKPPIERVVYRF